jgi:hypothetical protein
VSLTFRKYVGGGERKGEKKVRGSSGVTTIKGEGEVENNFQL